MTKPRLSVAKKLLLFDFDGVLVDSFEITFQCHIEMHGTSYTRNDVRKMFEANIFDTLKRLNLLEKEDALDFFALYEPKLRKLSAHPGITRLLPKLAERYTLVIISSNRTAVISNFLRRHGCLKYFTAVLGDDIHRSKVEKINTLLRTQRLTGRDCLLITDTLGDILEAKNCGVQSLAVAGGFHSKKTLRRGRPWKIIRWTQIPAGVAAYFKKPVNDKSLSHPRGLPARSRRRPVRVSAAK